MPKWVWWDTETALIEPARQAPPLSCVSYMQEGGEPMLIGYRAGEEWLRERLLDPEVIFVGHNVAYDFGVMVQEYPHLFPLVFEAYAKDRVTDTMLRQQILDNAIGRFRGYWRTWFDKEGKYHEKWVSISYSLDDCYRRATGKSLDKDTWRLRYGELREIPLEQWEEGARTYPKEDALATKEVFLWQEKQRQIIGEFYTQNLKHVSDPQPLADQFRQARAAWWIHLMRSWGIRTDPKRVELLERGVMADADRLRSRLQLVGLVRPDGSKDTKAAQARMVKAMGGVENCAKTESGAVQLDEDACDNSGDLYLSEYAELGSLGVVLSKDLPALRQGEYLPIHSNFASFMATGRTSSSRPNIQNIRRLQGIRECFVPRPGKVFLDADYDGLELRTLAQVCITLLGESKLAESLNQGFDPHLIVASKILKISYEEALARKKDDDVDAARQTGKVANFGFPGGLGFETLVVFAKKGYNVDLTVEEAQKLKKDWISAFPEMQKYFALIESYSKCDKEDRKVSLEQLFSKRLRGDCTYTAACNTNFQGLGADATKHAGFLIAWECYIDTTSPLFGCRIVNYIHDQFLLECDEDKAHEAAYRLARVMEEGANVFLPDVPALVSEPLVARCWSKKAKQKFNEKGRLIPWDMEFEVKSRAG